MLSHSIEIPCRNPHIPIGLHLQWRRVVLCTTFRFWTFPQQPRWHQEQHQAGRGIDIQKDSQYIQCSLRWQPGPFGVHSWQTNNVDCQDANWSSPSSYGLDCVQAPTMARTLLRTRHNDKQSGGHRDDLWQGRLWYDASSGGGMHSKKGT